MLKIIKDLYKFGATLLGAGYDNALTYLGHLLDLEVLEFPSGTEFETWKVPDEWIAKDAWVKFNGKKIIDYKKNPLSLAVYSSPFKGKVSKKELEKHLYWSSTLPTASPYYALFYKKEWGFCVPRDQVKEQIKVCKPFEIEGITDKPKFNDKLKKGQYEVFIDTEFRKGTMKVGVHTIPGKSKKEILLIAHLDHPYQANDNLSGVACLVDLAFQLKGKYEHTIKIIFCPETIGSIAYAFTQDISNIDFMIAVDICGNDDSVLIQKSFDKFSRINYVAHLAVQELGISYRKGDFRMLLGSDEYVFNDPKVGIPGIMLTTHPYDEYHTDQDTPDKIKIGKIKEMQRVILKIIEIYEKDYKPSRIFKGPLMRTRFDVQTTDLLTNKDFDYLIYDMDGNKWLSELVAPLGLTFSRAYNFLEKLYENNRSYIGKKRQ